MSERSSLLWGANDIFNRLVSVVPVVELENRITKQVHEYNYSKRCARAVTGYADVARVSRRTTVVVPPQTADLVPIIFPLDATLAIKVDMEYLFHNCLQISPGQKAVVRQGEREHRCLHARRPSCQCYVCAIRKNSTCHNISTFSIDDSLRCKFG